jgi:phospholipase/carboxylesterase
MTDSDSETAHDAAILPPLLACLEKLALIARYLDPLDFAELMAAVGPADAPLCDALAAAGEPSDEDGARLRAAGEEALAAFDGLTTALFADDIRAVFRALRHPPRALEALYPLASRNAMVDLFFLDPSRRGDAAAVAPPAGAEGRGVTHHDNEQGHRGGYSLYVPEDAAPDEPLPLVMALHGGSGHGRAFLWTWLRDARSFRAIVVAPTAIGATWALTGEDVDTPNLMRILGEVRARWPVDPARLLLTGLSDGGTFCYLGGLADGSPFTHLAPVAAAFHPMLMAFADPERLRGLPVHLVHGARDWMFPVELARQAHTALDAAGADVTYREFDDLSHAYPREINAELLAWLKR